MLMQVPLGKHGIVEIEKWSHRAFERTEFSLLNDSFAALRFFSFILLINKPIFVLILVFNTLLTNVFFKACLDLFLADL